MNDNYVSTLPEVIIRFLNYQSNVKNKSELTLDEYSLDLRLFFKFLVLTENNHSQKVSGDDIEKVDITGLTVDFFRKVTLDDGYRFLSYCKNVRNNKERARARKVSSIRTFFKYLKTNNYIDENPMINLDSPKLKKTLPKYLTVEESIKLLSCVDGPNRERDYCILTLFLNCGLRLSELVSINYTDIIYEDDIASVIITGKGNKERTVYLNNACLSAISVYMRVRPKDGVKDKNALFLSNRLTRISTKTVQHLVDVYLTKAGLEGKGLSVHKLRHTAATLMYQSGKVDILELKELLGHENLNTTQIYTHLKNDKLKDAVRANPLANFDASGSKKAFSSCLESESKDSDEQED